jgi:hypothetical protein
MCIFGEGKTYCRKKPYVPVVPLRITLIVIRFMFLLHPGEDLVDLGSLQHKPIECFILAILGPYDLRVFVVGI